MHRTTFSTALAAILALSATTVHAREFWTIELGMVGSNVYGAAGVIIKGTPTGGNPDGPWLACEGNWLYFHEYYHNATDTTRTPVAADRLQNLLSTATVAWVGKYKVRVGIDRDPATGKCYGTQFYLQH